jgi:hypothetical protein
MQLAQHVSGIIMPIIRSTEVNQQTAYDVQHCNTNKVKVQFGVYSNQNQTLYMPETC